MDKKSCFLIIIGLLVWNIGLSQSNTFPSSGNVGIGTTSPDYPLHIVYSEFSSLTIERTSGPPHLMFKVGADEGRIFYRPGDRLTIQPQGTSEPFIVEANSGYVGIGTTNPTELLTVNGTAKAEEVIVVENVGADFVFEEDYDLPKLSDVEAHIKKHKRLPEIPSAEEMMENGVRVGDLQMKLLQKIEELTLYTIKQQTLLEQQQKNIEVLKKELQQLKGEK